MSFQNQATIWGVLGTVVFGRFWWPYGIRLGGMCNAFHHEVECHCMHQHYIIRNLVTFALWRYCNMYVCLQVFLFDTESAATVSHSVCQPNPLWNEYRRKGEREWSFEMKARDGTGILSDRPKWMAVSEGGRNELQIQWHSKATGERTKRWWKWKMNLRNKMENSDLWKYVSSN